MQCFDLEIKSENLRLLESLISKISEGVGILLLTDNNMAIMDRGLNIRKTGRMSASRSNLVVNAALSIGLAHIMRTLAEKITTTYDPLHDVVNDSDEDEDFDWNKNLTDSKVIPDVISQGVQYNLKVRLCLISRFFFVF